MKQNKGKYWILMKLLCKRGSVLNPQAEKKLAILKWTRKIDGLRRPWYLCKVVFCTTISKLIRVIRAIVAKNTTLLA